MHIVANQSTEQFSLASAAQTVRDFFAAHLRHDVEQMVDLCTDVAEFNYVPYEVWGKQRVLRGDGKVCGIGKVMWAGMFDSFPDLTNRVTSVVADEQGNVAAEVVLSGTQAKVWGTIGNTGLHFELPHLFRFRVDADGKIQSVHCYWDCADFYQQLDRVEID